MRSFPTTALIWLAALVTAGCTLATYDRALDWRLGYAPVEGQAASVRTPVVVEALEDDRSDPQWVATARTAREWRGRVDEDVAAWVTQGLRTGLHQQGVIVMGAPPEGAFVVRGRLDEAMSHLQTRLEGSNDLKGDITVELEIERDGQVHERELTGKYRDRAVTDIEPALQRALEGALADLALQLAKTLAEIEAGS